MQFDKFTFYSKEYGKKKTKKKVNRSLPLTRTVVLIHLHIAIIKSWFNKNKVATIESK